MEEQLVEVLRFFLKIIIEDIPSRHSCNRWRKCRRFSTSTSRPLILQFLVLVVLKVNKVFFQDRVRFLLRVVIALEVFTVFSQARVLCSALVSRSLTLQFVVVELLEVFKVLSQDKVRRSGPSGRRHGLSPDLHLAALPAVLRDMGRLLVFDAGWCWRVWYSFWSTL